MYTFQRAFSVTPRQASRAYAARASLPNLRQLHASPAALKSATEKAAEVADKVCTNFMTRKKPDLTWVGVERSTSQLAKAWHLPLRRASK